MKNSRSKIHRILIILITVICISNSSQGFEYTKKDLGYRLNINHLPLPKWKIIEARSGDKIKNIFDPNEPEVTLFKTDPKDPKGNDMVMYFLLFDKKELPKELRAKIAKPILLGWKFEFSGYMGIARDRITDGQVEYSYRKKEKKKMVTKKYFASGFFQDLQPAGLDWNNQNNHIPFVFPTVIAETNNKWSLVNTYDSAAITLGIMQFSAVDGKDLLQLFIKMFDNPLLNKQATNWDNPKRWFPEFYTENSKLFWSKTKMEIRNSIGKRSWEEEVFMRIFNPTIRPSKTVDKEELHAIARWIIWSQSKQMRNAQIIASTEIAQDVVKNLAKTKSLPQGVTSLDLAICYSILHWNDGKSGYKTVENLLEHTNNISEEFLRVGRLRSSEHVPNWVAVGNKYEFWQRAKRIQNFLKANPALKERLIKMKSKNIIN